MKRYQRLDDIRGITLFSMILFHTVWDLVFIFDVEWDWFYTDLAYVWQQSICCTFIALSGFCWSLGRRKLYRGLVTLGAGFLVSFVTQVFVPNQRIQFGVLTLIGSSMLLMILLEKLLLKIKAIPGLVGSMLLFLLMKNVNAGYLGFEGLQLWKLPEEWYHRGDIATFLGFTDTSFYSADYFSFLPWFLLFLAGYFFYRVAERFDWLKKLSQKESMGKLWNVMGRKSLLIYMLHQPVVYGILLILDKVQII